MAVASLILAPNLEVTQLRSDIADKGAAIQYLITDENASAGAELQLSDAAVRLADASQVNFYADGIPPLMKSWSAGSCYDGCDERDGLGSGGL